MTDFYCYSISWDVNNLKMEAHLVGSANQYSITLVLVLQYASDSSPTCITTGISQSIHRELFDSTIYRSNLLLIFI